VSYADDRLSTFSAVGEKVRTRPKAFEEVVGEHRAELDQTQFEAGHALSKGQGVRRELLGVEGPPTASPAGGIGEGILEVPLAGEGVHESDLRLQSVNGQVVGRIFGSFSVQLIADGGAPLCESDQVGSDAGGEVGDSDAFRKLGGVECGQLLVGRLL
jgi:hypothetical protein